MNNTNISEKIKNILLIQFNNSSINVTNNNSYVYLLIISTLFEDKSLIERHNMVYNVLKHMIATQEIHALSLKTYTPNEYIKKSHGKIINTW